MNQNEKQTLVDQFQDWLRSSFLPDQKKRKGRTMSRAEWERHFNGLSMMFACFVFCHPLLNRVTSCHTASILAAFQDHVRTTLQQGWEEEGVTPSLEEQQAEEEYFFYPVSLFLSVKTAQCN